MMREHVCTTTIDPVVRLLFVLVSFVLWNFWLIIRLGVLSLPRRGEHYPLGFNS